MSELLPCPFCGASYEKDEDDFVYAADHDEWCPLRGTAYGGYGLTVGDTEGEIAAWNTRSEVDPDTAAAFGAKSYRNGYANGYKDALEQRAERTCKRVIKTNERPGKTVFNQWYACSECGNPMGHGESFCAGCGAKVVGD